MWDALHRLWSRQQDFGKGLTPREGGCVVSPTAEQFGHAQILSIIESHLVMLEGIVTRVVGADGPGSVGYVEQFDHDGRIEERLTELGLRTVRHAHELAVDAERHLAEIGDTIFRSGAPQGHLRTLIDDVDRLLAMVAEILGGIATHRPTAITTWGARSMLQDMLKRVRGYAEEVANV